MDINSVKKLGSPGQNVVIETAGKIYIKVQDRFYELDFKNLGKSTQNTVTNIVNNNSTPTDLSKYVSKDYLKSALSQYVTTKTWQSVKATQYALQNSGLSGFSESINPITIDTMQLLVGAEQLQYDFVNHLGYYTENPDTKMPTLGGLSTIIYNDPTFSDSIRLVCNPGIIKHYVYNGPEAVQAGMQDFQYCRWIVSEAINQDSLSDDNIWAIKHYDFNIALDWKSQITPPTLNPFIVDLPINDKIYYLYIQAYYMDSNMTRELGWPTITGDSEIAAWLREYYNIESGSPIIMPISFTFSQLVSLYDSLLGQKKRMIKEDEENFATNWANEWDDWENKLIKYLYEFKVGTARYVLTETPLGEYEYVYDEETRQYTDEILAYNFLYAIVGNNGSSGRSITTLNGFTEITPGQVTAYIFKTPDGQQYINFKDGTLHIGNPYEDKKGEWMHYSPDGGLEISGKLTVTGGGLQDELNDLTKLALGEYKVWYSDQATFGDLTTERSSIPASLYGVYWKEDIDWDSEEQAYPEEPWIQYLPYPNDSDPDKDVPGANPKWYDKHNWPDCLWSDGTPGDSDNIEDFKSGHINDLYIVSRDDSTIEGDQANLAFRYRKTTIKNNGEDEDIYYWTLLDNSDLGLILNTLDGYEYLKRALGEPTTILGGLILTSAIELGYTEGGVRKTTAGMSGLVVDTTYKTDIAAWYGGYKIDPIERVNNHACVDYRELVPGGPTYPQILFRQDGSGYLGGLNGSYVPAISWDSSNLTIREDVLVTRSNGDPIELGQLGSNFFKLVYIQGNTITDTQPSSGEFTVAVKLKTTLEGGGEGIISDGFISAFGYSGSEGGSGGDASWPDDPEDGDILIWDNAEGAPIWVDPTDPTEFSVGYATAAGTAVSADSATTAITSSYLASPGLTLWGNPNIGTNGNMNCGSSTGGVKSLSYVGNINFTDDGTSGVYLSTTAPTGVSSYQNTLYVRGNLVATGFISAFRTSSSGGSSSGDANSIARKPVIEPQSWSGLDGKTLIYDSSENDGEGAWVIGNAGISASNSPSDNYLLGWSSSSAQWVNPNSITVGSATTASRLYSDVYLWGNSFNGSSSIGSGEDESDVASLNNVEDIVFGVITDESEEETSDYVGLSLASNRDYHITDTLYLYGILNSKGGISTTSLSTSGTITSTGNISTSGSLISSSGIYFGNNFSWTSASTYTAELKRGTTSLFLITGTSNNNRAATLNATLTLGSSSYPKNLIVMGNDIFIGGTTHYLRYVPAASNVPAYLLTDLPIVSSSFISAYGVSNNQSYNPEEPEEPEEPDEEPEEPSEGESEELDT